MADRLNFELQDAEILGAIDRVLQLLEQPGELMVSIGDYMESAARLRFDSKTDPSGKAWAPLSPTTVAIYESEWFKKLNPDFANGIPGTLLDRTRQLMDSLGYNVGSDYVDIGTTRPTRGGAWQIGALHEWGTRKMPRRGILAADPESGELGAGDQAAVLELVSDALGRAFD